MSKQIQATKEEVKQAIEETAPVEAKDLKNKELAEDVIDILDEIDGVLEENAQAFVAAFVQRGGQ